MAEHLTEPYLMDCGRCRRTAFLRVISVEPLTQTKRYGIQCSHTTCSAQMTGWDRELLIQRWNVREMEAKPNE